MKPDRIDLSVIIPTFNEAGRIEGTVRSVVGFFESKGLSFEVIVSDSGSTDGTAGIVERISKTDGRVNIVQARGSGKGAAVREGMLAAKGELRLFTDADISTPIKEFDKLRAALNGGKDVAIASRGLPGSEILIHQPRHREFLSRLLNKAIRIFYVPGIFDTQCGFKLFKGDVARELFGRQKLDGFLFDVEILYLARKGGYGIAEVPVVWRHSEPSKVSVAGDLFGIVFDFMRIRSLHRA